MARVTETDVREIITTQLDDLTAHITMANALITAAGISLSEAILKEIERWLAAHFVAIHAPEIMSETIGDAKETKELQVGMLGQGLKATRWGQQALLLDTTGKLAGLGKKEASLKWIGT